MSPNQESEVSESDERSLADAQAAANAQAQIELHKKLAPRYQLRYAFEFSRLFEHDWHAEILSHIPSGPGLVMDLGCGTGLFLADIIESGEAGVGVDISHAMLSVGRSALPDAMLLTGDAEHLPVDSGSFKAVVCKGSLHHARNHVAFISNSAKILDERGLLVMSEPCNDNPMIRFARWMLYRNSEHFDEGDQGFCRRDLVALYEEGGFEVTKVKKYGFLAYALCGFPDHIGIMRYVPGSKQLTKLFIAIDRVICAIPGLSLLAFQLIVVGKPKR